MKKFNKLIIAIIGIVFSMNVHAQFFDLTTGTDGAGGVGTIGTNDPIWTMQLPGGGGFGPVTISTGVLQSGGTTFPNAYVQDNCGQWISPWVNGANNIVSGPGTPGIFTYQMQFSIDQCVINPTALLDLNFMAADNAIVAVRVNGVAQTIPGGITHLVPGSMTSAPAVVNGVNTIQVDVNNWGSYTALQLCGGITISGSASAPTNLDCCSTLAGEVLSWSPVAGAIGYQVEIVYNDPECCPHSEAPYKEEYNVGTNVLIINPTSCYSWRVRAILSGNCFSDWSEKNCGCSQPPSHCKIPEKLDCKIIENGTLLSWAAISGASSYEVEVNYNDPACCESDELPYTGVYTTTTNSFTVPNSSLCFSWRVRTICEDGSKSDWTGLKCSCNGFLFKSTMGENSEKKRVNEVMTSLDPNPASNFITISIVNPTETLKSNTCEFVIVDLSGATALTESINLNESKRVNIGQLKPGMYICKVLAEGRVVSTEKFVVK